MQGWDVSLLILTVLDGDSNRGYHNPYQGLLVEGGEHPKFRVSSCRGKP